jgi:hypothetical protein
MHLKKKIFSIANSKSSSHDNWSTHYPIFHEKNAKQHLLKKTIIYHKYDIQIIILGLFFNKLIILAYMYQLSIIGMVHEKHESLIMIMFPV